jgi:hypothetical protein
MMRSWNGLVMPSVETGAGSFEFRWSGCHASGRIVERAPWEGGKNRNSLGCLLNQRARRAPNLRHRTITSVNPPVVQQVTCHHGNLRKLTRKAYSMMCNVSTTELSNMWPNLYY